MCGPVVGLSRAGGQNFQLEETISKSFIGKHDFRRNSLHIKIWLTTIVLVLPTFFSCICEKLEKGQV